MSLYIKLKDGSIHVGWSDNAKEETMNVYPIEDEATFDPCVSITVEVDYSDIVVSDTNLSIVENFKAAQEII